MNDYILKKKKKEFRSSLFWGFLNIWNYAVMTAAASVMCQLLILSSPPIRSIRSRVYVSLILFVVLYVVLCRIYQGLRVETMRVSEMIYSQTLSCIIADVLLCLTLWMISGKLIPLQYPILVLLIQMLFSFLWSFLCNRTYFSTNRPSKTVLVYNRRSGLRKLVREYGLEKKFDVQNIYHVDDIVEQVELLEQYETVFMSDVHSKERNVILKYCVEHSKQLFVIPRIGDTLMSSAIPMHMFHLPMVEVPGYKPSPTYLIFKRCFDIVVSLLALILLSPVFLVTAIAIKATDGGPVFYKQERMTRYGREFMIHKFRSMRVDAEKDGVARLSTGASDSRITPVGRVIRACRIDELPQLIDILKGDLSVVGPRPERRSIAEQYEETMPEFRLRLLAKAGLTGYAQVYGKYNSTPYDKLHMDLMYIAHPSIIQDLKICFATVKILFLPESTEGVAEGSVTAMGQYGGENGGAVPPGDGHERDEEDADE